MTQATLGTIAPGSTNGTMLASMLSLFGGAVETCNKGASRPTYVKEGMIWVDDTSSSMWKVNMFDGTNDVLIGSINTTTHQFVPTSGNTIVSLSPTGSLTMDNGWQVKWGTISGTATPTYNLISGLLQTAFTHQVFGVIANVVGPVTTEISYSSVISGSMDEVQVLAKAPTNTAVQFFYIALGY